MDPIDEQEGIAPEKGRIGTLTELCIRRGNGALELELTLPVVPRCAVVAALGSVLRRMAKRRIRSRRSWQRLAVLSAA
jgi:hypothetical protein